MKKIIIICGLISGIICSGLMIFSAIGCSSGNIDPERGMIYGYASMLLAFSLIFVGIKNFRDKNNNREISFKKAFTIGFFIALIASTMYVLVWLIDYYIFIPDFADKYATHAIQRLQASGASQAEIQQKTLEMANFKTMYKNPLMVILFTYIEVLPVGLLVSLIAALILKRKPKQTTSIAN